MFYPVGSITIIAQSFVKIAAYHCHLKRKIRFFVLIDVAGYLGQRHNSSHVLIVVIKWMLLIRSFAHLNVDGFILNYKK